ncbi:metal-dependent hydrolase [Lewinellaceae bacterium SD302]|nr:metal-dependent hydrolase [Lewinellaceae bacterium SD302]
MVNKQLVYGTQVIDYSLAYAERKTMRIRVDPEGDVSVVAPIGSTEEIIEERLLKKASWIRRQRDFFLSFQPRRSARKYVSGESHFYLGKRYRLRLVSVDAVENEFVKLIAGQLVIQTQDVENKEQIKSLLYDWYNDKAALHFSSLLDSQLVFIKPYYEGEIKLDWKQLEKHWGICRKNGRMTLNLELIKVPKHCIRYVIIHELCHLKYFNHSHKFWTLLTRILPNWKNTKEELEYFLDR